jgi:hypothetical protein
METILMNLPRLFLVSIAAIAFPLASSGDPPAPLIKANASPISAGKWRVEFANGVVQTVEVRGDATATVTEPGRTAGAKVTPIAGTALVVYDDDRVERWTPVGRRMVVEHWFPASQFPNGNPVRGIAESAD